MIRCSGATAAAAWRSTTYPDLTIRVGDASNARDVAGVHASSWRDAFQGILNDEYLRGAVVSDRLAVWHERLVTPQADKLLLIAEYRHENIVGFAYAAADESAIWGSLLDNLHVLLEHQGKGIGARLVSATAEGLTELAINPSLHLWVFEANARACGFYERLGGRVVGCEPSDIPAADRKTLLHIHWPDLQGLCHLHCPTL